MFDYIQYTNLQKHTASLSNTVSVLMGLQICSCPNSILHFPQCFLVQRIYFLHLTLLNLRFPFKGLFI
jgi:hypothetical protein